VPELNIVSIPKIVGFNLDKEAIRRPLSRFPTGNPQVLINYSPVSREAWRIKACLDQRGRAAGGRFITVRPKSAHIKAIHLWAILNSPIANAFVYTHLGKRDIIAGTLKKMPLPKLSSDQAAQIERAALHYYSIASDGPLFNNSATPEGIREALLAMDAAVLRAYDLPARLEHELLTLFWRVERKGVGCQFDGYYGPDSRPFQSLYVRLSEEFQRSTAGQILQRRQILNSEAALAASDKFFELNGEG
jgi:hypothetical protein